MPSKAVEYELSLRPDLSATQGGYCNLPCGVKELHGDELACFMLYILYIYTFICGRFGVVVAPSACFGLSLAATHFIKRRLKDVGKG